MFRDFLSSKNKLQHLNVEWIQKLEGLIRVVIFDPDEKSNNAFVIVYFEKTNQYLATAFDVKTGNILWTKNVANGGYGAPIATNNAFIFPTKFTNISALSKEDGTELWQVQTNYRIRSALNINGDKLYFSSGGNIYELDLNGKITNCWGYKGAFFYGSVDVSNELIISLGTITDENEDSLIKIFAFHKKGNLAYSIPISKSPIVSSDTIAITWKNNIGFVGGNNLIVCFDGCDGNILWKSNVEGFAGRHTCSIDDHHLYYSTMSGIVGALDISNGSSIWKIHAIDKSIVAPITVQNDHIMLLADAHLNVLKSNNGQIVRKIPVGHSPYSMVSIKGEYALLGSGEPPHNGLLYAFKLSQISKKEKYECFLTSFNAFIESPFVDILINVSDADENLISVKLDGAIFNIPEPIEGKKINISTFIFRVPLPKTISSGDFVFPLYLYLKSNKQIIKTACISFKRKNPLPVRAYLNHIPDIIQEKPNYSGAAIGSAIKNLYGDYVEQSKLRDMIDFSLNYSGYEPFQTWRILLRRILTSEANNIDKLPENIKN